MKYIQVYALFLMLVFCTSCEGQNKPDLPKENIKPKSGWLRVKDDGNGTTRAGFSLKGQNLFCTLNGKEIHCGKINLKI